MDAKITIKNYRCFSDSNPAVLHIKPGIISFVGPNNSGKSTLLKMIHELHNLWERLISAQGVANTINPGISNVPYVDVHDSLEIFNNKNTRPINITIELGGLFSDTEISKVLLETTRENPNNWTMWVYTGPKQMQFSILTPPMQVTDKEIIYRGHLQFNVVKLTQFMKILCGSLYFGAFRNSINSGAGTYYGLQVGTAFVDLWNAWKTDIHNKSRNNNIQSVTEDIAHIFRCRSLEINRASDGSSLQVVIDKKSYALDELGAGIAQFIYVLGNVATRSPTYILIDEPELNLHATLQRDFITSLAKYASQGIIFATHSMGLARTVSDEIYSVQNKDNGSEVHPFAATNNAAEFLGELQFSAYRELGFKKILLVEGVSDVKTFQVILRWLGIDHQIVIIPLGGKQLANGDVATELDELNRISPGNIYALVDSEKESETSEPLRERSEFEKICGQIGIHVHLTERRATENYLTREGIQQVFGPTYSQLTNYESLKSHTPGWGKKINWRIVQNMSWKDFENNDVGQFLLSLK